MITSALGFITSRKWLVELILAAVVAIAIYAGCLHLIQMGVLKERSVWQEKVRQANLETARKQGIADAAEAAQKREHDELSTYVSTHPLSGSLDSLCHRRSLPATSQTLSGNAGTGAASTTVQPVPESGDSGESGIDQLGLLSAIAERSDQVSAQLREWQAR